MSGFVKRRLKHDNLLTSVINPLWDMALKAKMVAVASLAGVASDEDVKSAVRAIELRNELVHEGKSITEAEKPLLYALIRVTSGLLSEGPFKFPSIFQGNQLDAIGGATLVVRQDPSQKK